MATGNNSYRAGYFQTAPVNTNFEIVGADKEREQYVYRQGNFIYINRGANGSLKVGDEFAVFRLAYGDVKKTVRKSPEKLLAKWFFQ